MPPAVRLVLVRPRNPLNLVAAARAAANFGFEDIVAVSPYEPTWKEARAARVGGKWLRHARRVSSLLEAVEDRNWVVGTSSLARRQVDPSRVCSLDQLAARAAGDKGRNLIAVVFGSEKRGLSNQDLELCHAILRIPTSQVTPSMNLGHAVAVSCYELRRVMPLWHVPKKVPVSSASVGEVARLVEELNNLLTEDDMSPGKRWRRQERLRRMMLRLPLSSEEVALVLGVLRDLSRRLRGPR